MRIRTVKPELIQQEKFATLSDPGARLYYGLLGVVDDGGRCTAAPSFLAGNIFWGKQRSATSIGKLVVELEAAGWIRTYVISGGAYLEIIGWGQKGSTTFQQLDKSKTAILKFPAPESIPVTPPGVPYPDQDPDPEPEGISGQKGQTEEISDDDIARLIHRHPPGLMPAVGGRERTTAALRAKSAEGFDLESLELQLERYVDHNRGKEKSIRDRDAYLAGWILKSKRGLPEKATKKPTKKTKATEKTKKPKTTKQPTQREKPAQSALLTIAAGAQMPERFHDRLPVGEWWLCYSSGDGGGGIQRFVGSIAANAMSRAYTWRGLERDAVFLAEDPFVDFGDGFTGRVESESTAEERIGFWLGRTSVQDRAYGQRLREIYTGRKAAA